MARTHAAIAQVRRSAADELAVLASTADAGDAEAGGGLESR